MKRIGIIIIGLLVSLNAFSTPTETQIEKQNQSSEYSGASMMEMLVYANSAVDDMCNYFNGSWVDVGLTVYCSLGGDIYTCTAYKIIQAACTVNGAVKLYIEGDIEGALKRAIQGTTKIYTISKISRTEFKITDTRSNMTPRSEWY